MNIFCVKFLRTEKVGSLGPLSRRIVLGFLFNQRRTEIDLRTVYIQPCKMNTRTLDVNVRMRVLLEIITSSERFSRRYFHVWEIFPVPLVRSSQPVPSRGSRSIPEFGPVLTGWSSEHVLRVLYRSYQFSPSCPCWGFITFNVAESRLPRG